MHVHHLLFARTHSSRFLRGHRAADVPILLGYGEPEERAGPDRWPTPSFSSIAAVGFALPAYAIGIERGWCTRAEARDLTLTTLRFFWNAPQGPESSGTAGYKGFFYHFLNMETGLRHRDVELSSVDTTILMMGVLFASQYYDRADAAEREIRDLAQKIYARADWNFFRSDGRAAISMGWHPGGA
ncbi:hypothetical protein [Sphingomonas sediminicola]|uniref:hypothetical protein n=1 Tax=Sphingomonas sediminicola TaxID=386874 RepID=UPI001FEB96E0|nr:hypothetical protein [Sphingomonas sediminicola]